MAKLKKPKKNTEVEAPVDPVVEVSPVEEETITTAYAPDVAPDVLINDDEPEPEEDDDKESTGSMVSMGSLRRALDIAGIEFKFDGSYYVTGFKNGKKCTISIENMNFAVSLTIKNPEEYGIL